MTYTDQLEAEYNEVFAIYTDARYKTIKETHAALAAYVLKSKAEGYVQGCLHRGAHYMSGDEINADLQSLGYIKPTE